MFYALISALTHVSAYYFWLPICNFFGHQIVVGSVELMTTVDTVDVGLTLS